MRPRSGRSPVAASTVRNKADAPLPPRLCITGKQVTHLEYESYVPLALKTLHSVLLGARDLPAPILPATTHCFDHSHHHAPPLLDPTSAEDSTPRIDLTHVTAYHLLGPSPPLTPSIVICVSSPHRKEAFVACEWVLEEVKKRVQVWKREWYADGTTFQGRDGEGVEGPGNRIARPAEGTWKENFPPASTAAEGQ